MKLVQAFLQLVRWPNLVFIALTQLLFYYCIYQPVYGSGSETRLGWLVLASVLIAAAGYIINDYFDINIDRINKPHKNVVDSAIRRRWAMFWHLFLNAAGLAATVLAVGLDRWYLILANAGCVLLLWFYSTSFKRQLLIGNVVISLLTAWTVLILFFALQPLGEVINSTVPASVKFFRISFLYASFAFIISLIREAVKDMEDLEGDARYQCRTLPIVTGLRTAKVYVAVWSGVLLAALLVLQLYVLQFGWWLAVAYSVVLVMLPLAVLLRQIAPAYSPAHFARLSRLAKWVMLTGILSMIFFRIYA